MNPDWRPRYDALIRAAGEAGKHALSYFPDCQSDAFADQVIWKGDNSPVSVADREAEAMLKKQLLEQFPGDGFLGEETGEILSTTGFRWVVDPIDGTRSFVRGVPHWATLAAIEYDDQPIAGVAYEPVIDRMWRAMRGDGAYRDDLRIHVSTIDSLAESQMFYSSMSWFMKADKQAEFIQLVRATQRQRGFGDYYGHLLLAQGAGEFMIEHGVHEWDIAALKVIVEESGGRFTDWNGISTVKHTDCLASNGKVHDAVMAILRGPA